MPNTTQEQYNTEVHETETLLEGVTNPDSKIKGDFDKLKKKAQATLSTVNSLITDAIGSETDPTKRSEKIAKLTSLVNAKVALDTYKDKITNLSGKLDNDKKTAADTLMKNLTAEFNKAEKISPDEMKKSLTAAPVASNQNEKNDTNDKKKKEMERRHKVIDDLATNDTTLKGNVDTLNGSTDLKETPYGNSVLTTIFEKTKDMITDTTIKGQFNATYEELKKPAKHQDMPLRSNFLKILHSASVPADKMSFTEEQIVAAENIWRMRMNKDTGPDGKRAVSSPALQMLSLADIQGSVDTTLIPAETTPAAPAPANDATTQASTDTSQNTNSTPSTNPTQSTTSTTVDTQSQKLEWSKDKEKIVNDTITAATTALQSKKSVDLASGSILEFEGVNKEKITFSKDMLVVGNNKIQFNITSSGFTLPLKNIAYLDATSATVTLGTPSIPLVSDGKDKSSPFDSDNFKKFFTSALGIIAGDTTVPPKISSTVDGKNIEITLTKV